MRMGSILVGERTVALAMAPEITSLLPGSCSVVKISKIRCSRAYDRGIEIYHRSVGRRASPNDPMRIVTGSAAIASMIPVWRGKNGQIVALIAQRAARGRIAASAACRLLIQVHLQQMRIGGTVRPIGSRAFERPCLIIAVAISAIELRRFS